MNENCPLESISQLTQARDEASLVADLVTLLHELIPHHTVRLLRLPTDFDNGTDTTAIAITDVSAPGNRARHRLGDIDGLVEAMAARKRVDVPGTESKLYRVYPVQHALGPWGFLVMNGPGAAPEVLDIVDPLLRIVSNQLFLLSQSERDALTGLLNRQALEALAEELQGSKAAQRRAGDTENDARLPRCLGLIDIDHFKQVNDTFGHLYGDEVLLLFSRLMRESFRTNDLLYRYGGEEFAVVLAGIDLDIAARVLERFRAAIEGYRFPQVGQKTVSIGLTRLEPGLHLRDLIGRADQALYWAKHNGRNRLGVYETLVEHKELNPDQITDTRIDLFR